jgi:membrane protein YqaA with SNARE-associated domain
MIAATFFYCIASALVPVINAEVYVSGVAAGIDGIATGASLWALACAAAAGQMVGKVAYFLLGRSSLNWGWVRKKTESERWKAALDRWQRRIGGRAWLAGAILLVSAFAGFPPFAVLSVIAGQLRVPLPLFVVVGFIGRTARFAAVLGLVGVLAKLA